jgi:hypothetical protein
LSPRPNPLAQAAPGDHSRSWRAAQLFAARDGTAFQLTSGQPNGPGVALPRQHQKRNLVFLCANDVAIVHDATNIGDRICFSCAPILFFMCINLVFPVKK